LLLDLDNLKVPGHDLLSLALQYGPPHKIIRQAHDHGVNFDGFDGLTASHFEIFEYYGILKI